MHRRLTAFRLFSFLLLVFVGALGAAPQPKFFVTSEKSSKLNFNLTLAVFELEGVIERFSGSLRLDDKQFEKSQLLLDLDPSSLSISPPEQFKGFQLDGLLEKIPPTKVTFKSTKIVKTGKNSYQMHGTVTRKGKSWKVTLPLEVASLTPPIFRIAASGEITEWDREIPLPVTPGHDRGEVKALLKFTPSK